MYFFTADEHYGHKNIIQYCNRPFDSVEEMDQVIIERHNSVVSDDDIVVHAGDFTMLKTKPAKRKYVAKLNGHHIFLRGSHDNWLGKDAHEIWEKSIDGQHVVVCHYALRVWGKSHYNSWQLFGHTHGQLEPVGKQWDIGVDNNDFYPLSFEQLEEIMDNRPDNIDSIKKS